MKPTRGGLRVRHPEVIEQLTQARPASIDRAAEPIRRAAEIAAVTGGSYGRHDGRKAAPARRRLRVVLPSSVALVTAAAIGVVFATVSAGHGRGSAQPGGSAAIKLSARDILLSAATHVPSAAASGKFWKTTTISGVLMAAGTSAHPYNMFIPTRSTQWLPRRSGVREWTVSRTLGLVPATTADAAAWHAAGSPNSWHYVKTTVTTSASRPSARWQVSDGTVGLVEGDEPGLTPAQFRAMPASPRALLARLRHYAQATWCGSHHSWGCSTVDQIVWSEAVNLLQDPVTPAVRAATFHVMAGLPGVRLLGKMRDPMGRPGYGIGSGASAPGDIAVIDPATGSLLAVEGKGSAVFNTQGYFGPSYPGQVGRYEVVVSDAWTNMAPVLPPRFTWTGPNGQRG